jgi:anaerobic nitric oxide reductase transcription regulator
VEPSNDTFMDLALDLTTSMPARDRFQRLVGAVRGAFSCDAVALLGVQGGVLVPIAAEGLVPDALGRRFVPADHPRLEAILDSRWPVRFSWDDDRPDPLDGLISGARTGDLRVHSCMGCSLFLGDELVGVLTMDSLAPGVFDEVDDRSVATLAALAAAAVRMAGLIDALEESTRHCVPVAPRPVGAASEKGSSELVGESDAIVRLRREVTEVAPSNLAVLITGETGVGKELVARRIHATSPRASKPLVYVNCAALPESLAESELFGHCRGAFTGAASERAGKFELADGGTIFLDEIGELPASIQPKLLRVLQDGEIQRVGSDRYHRTDVRVIAATNRDLGSAVASGRFRADLFHRISVLVVAIPPLREREGDVALLSGYFLDRAQRHLGLGAVRLTEDARNALVAASWPGNVRELEHVVLRAVVRAAGGRRGEPVEVRLSHLDIPVTVPERPVLAVQSANARQDLSLASATADFQRARIGEALTRCNGNWTEAARRLGVDRSNLYRLARRLGFHPSGGVVSWTPSCPMDYGSSVV